MTWLVGLNPGMPDTVDRAPVDIHDICWMYGREMDVMHITAY